MSDSVSRKVKLILAGLLLIIAIGILGFQLKANHDKIQPAAENQEKPFRTGTILMVDRIKYKTVQSAIDKAAYGDVVRVKSGLYNESLTLRDGVVLEGEDGNNVIIQCDMRIAPVLTINNCRNVQVARLTLNHYNPIQVESRTDGKWPIVKIEDSTAALKNLIVSNSDSQGIAIRNGSRANEMVSVTDCTIYNNHSYGIIVTGSGKVKLKNNTCVNNKRNGILLMDDSKGIVSSNLCQSNEHHGISIGDNAEAEVSENTCCQNKWSGIYFGSTSSFNVNDNNCFDNGYSGIDIDRKAIVSAVGNICRRNGINGIYFKNGASGTISQNICAENDWHGISIDKDSRPTVENNKCFNNKKCGIYDDGFMPGMNEIYDNGEFSWQEVHIYFRAEDFNELEKMASKIRNEKRRFKNGNWQLEYFYGAFEHHYSHQSMDDIIQLLEKWISQYPASVTPRIGLANALCTKAWEIRGTGYSYKVSPEAWNPFEQHLSKALDVLKEAEKLNVKDPGLYTIWISVAMGLHKLDEIEVAFKKGIEIEPTYYPLYFNRGFAYLPKWYGKPGQYEQLAAEAADSTKDQIGQSLYFLFACKMTRQVKDVNQFRESGFDYSRIKQGQKDFVRQFPDFLDMEVCNRLCFMACAAGDKEDARDYFMDIGDNWNEKLWRNIETFEKYKAWARNRNNLVKPE